MKQKSSQVEIGSAHMLTARYPADEGRPKQRCTRRGWTVGLVVRVEAMHSLSQRVPIRLPAVRDLRSGRRIRQAMWLQVLLPSIFSVNNGLPAWYDDFISHRLAQSLYFGCLTWSEDIVCE